MKADLYTKSVLTVIALCLLWSNLSRPPVIKAGENEQHVIISGVEMPRRSVPVHLTEPVEGCK
jgi:hypothetical protein